MAQRRLYIEQNAQGEGFLHFIQAVAAGIGLYYGGLSTTVRGPIVVLSGGSFCNDYLCGYNSIIANSGGGAVYTKIYCEK
jgi:hypothetical protein